ncbi:MAG: flagellar basal body L-ring protein FlgH, partial [Bacteroidota bacterium]
ASARELEQRLQELRALERDAVDAVEHVVWQLVEELVVGLFANGDLWISGNRTISINGEDQIVSISGIVRPSDIQADNSVYSYSISDAVIVFKGKGMTNDNQSPGWLTKLFHWIF